MRKRILTLILSMSVVLGIMMPVSATAVSDNSDSQISVLSGLGILKKISLVEYKPESNIAKFAFYTSIYNFMTDEEENEENVIAYLKRYNINIDEYTLRDNITREEALSAVVSMLGYTYRSVSGNELIRIADSFGIRRYLTGGMSGYITLDEAVNLLYGALDTEMMMIDVEFSGGGATYKRLTDITPLMYYKDIHKVKGTVNKNSYASVTDTTPAPKGYVQIGDEEMLAGVSNAGDYLGMPVEAYVRYDKDDEGTIVYISPNKKLVTVTKIEADDIVSVDDDIKKVEYEVENKVKYLNISSVVKVIYNGKNYGGYTKEDLMPDIGSLELIDTDNDRMVDVINVKNYKTVLVNYVSVYSETIVNKYSDPPTIVADSEKKEVVIERNGEIIDISEIKPNDVLLVAESKSGSDEIVHILASDKRESGVISGIDNDEMELKVSDRIYKFSNAYKDAIDDENIVDAVQLKLGKSYTFYLDAFGNVAYAVCTDGKNYAYATRVLKNDDDESFGIKLFNSAGEWQIVKFADNIKLNGEVFYKTVNGVKTNGDIAVYNHLSTFEPQLVRIEYNTDGEVKNIDMAENFKTSDQTKFTKYSMDRQRIYQPTGKTFGCDVYMKDDAKVFIIPSDKSREDDYTITNASYFTLDRWYQVEAYDIDEFHATDVIVYESDAKSVRVSDRYYVKEKYESFIDGEVRDVVNCIYNGTGIELVASDGWSLSDVNTGDILVLTTNSKGEITYSEIYKKVSKTVMKEYPSLTDPSKIHAGAAVAAGYVEKTDGEKGMFTADCGNEFPARFKFTSSARCYLYDGNEKERVKLISFADIEPGDGVYIFLKYSAVSEIYVMRNVK